MQQYVLVHISIEQRGITFFKVEYKQINKVTPYTKPIIRCTGVYLSIFFGPVSIED